MADKPFGSALVALGGVRGGITVPRWFGTFPGLGLCQAYLFWAVPAADEPPADLEALPSIAHRWIAQLHGLGVQGELIIKRGVPGPWLTAYAGICEADLVVAGPPSRRGGRSQTIEFLLDELQHPLLLLPDGEGPVEPDLLARPLVDLDGTPEARRLVTTWTRQRPGIPLSTERVGAARNDARQLLKQAVELDATVIVLASRARSLAPYLIRYGGLPVLVAPAYPRKPRRARQRAG